MLHFPEEVALKLTEVEYDLYYQVPPIAYIRHVTSDLRPSSQHFSTSTTMAVARLTKRFREVSYVLLLYIFPVKGKWVIDLISLKDSKKNS